MERISHPELDFLGVHINSLYWMPRTFEDPRAPFMKMIKNAEKAYEESLRREFDDMHPYYASKEEAVSKEGFLRESFLSPLTFTYSEAMDKKETEDVLRVKTMEEGSIASIVCRGESHDSNKTSARSIATFVADAFQNRIAKTLEKTRGCVFEMFESLTYEIEGDVLKQKEWDRQGTSLLVTYADPKTHTLYTSTLGSSQAFLYRKQKGGMYKVIPLSVPRDWSSPKDATRAGYALKEKAIIPGWTNFQEPTMIHFPLGNKGITLSRSIGHAIYYNYRKSEVDTATRATTDSEEAPVHALTCKPKVSIHRIKAGDVILAVTQGVTSVVSQRDLCNYVTLYTQGHKACETLADHIIHKMPTIIEDTSVSALEIR